MNSITVKIEVRNLAYVGRDYGMTIDQALNHRADCLHEAFGWSDIQIDRIDSFDPRATILMEIPFDGSCDDELDPSAWALWIREESRVWTERLLVVDVLPHGLREVVAA